MIPEPSKRPFQNPLAADALAFFTHPRHEVFRRVVRHAGGVYAANGYAAIRVTRGPLIHDDELPEAAPDFAKRVDSLPWRLVEVTGTTAAAPEFRKFDGTPDLSNQSSAWRKLDDSRATIYGGKDLLPLWVAGRMTETKPVMVAGSTMVPLAMLQLLARLPRAEVRMSTGDFLALRFASGEAIIPGRWRHDAKPPKPKFSLFLTREERESRDWPR